MSTPIYNEILERDIFSIEDVIKQLREDISKIEEQIKEGITIFTVHICAREIELDYTENELTIIV